MPEYRTGKLYNRRKSASPQPPPDAVYIGRGTQWGNPYKMAFEGPSEREYVVRMYRHWAAHCLKLDPTWLDDLFGKDLVCWCAPLLCHGQVLLEMIELELILRDANEMVETEPS